MLEIADFARRETYYLKCESKEDDKLCGNRAADLRFCFRICKIRFSHVAAYFIQDVTLTDVSAESSCINVHIR